MKQHLFVNGCCSVDDELLEKLRVLPLNILIKARNKICFHIMSIVLTYLHLKHVFSNLKFIFLPKSPHLTSPLRLD
ncbi:hypothetical protein RIF29_28126 [Crotalaria pallida]|uniref:Uncharacterized protein n=1 Tax=Crotalaria pallida TaxID=3830 RepID=A0AAN9I6A3_CROPI